VQVIAVLVAVGVCESLRDGSKRSDRSGWGVTQPRLPSHSHTHLTAHAGTVLGSPVLAGT
jgi:hypothetical protein